VNLINFSVGPRRIPEGWAKEKELDRMRVDTPVHELFYSRKLNIRKEQEKNS
jgi:hypothetical protein